MVTVTEAGIELQPLASVTVTVYMPAEFTAIDCVVLLLDH